MTTSYYTVERQCSPVGTYGAPIWFRLTYRREWVAERSFWRDTLVSQETMGHS